MALDGATSTFLPYTLNGLQDIAVDSSTVSTLQVNSLTPNRVVVSDSSNFLVSSSSTSTEVDYLSGTTSNLQTQLNAKASTSYLDTNFLNKVTATEQTITAASTFNSTVTANYFYTNNSYNWGRPSGSYNAWAIGRILNSGVIRDLQFKDDTANQTTLLLSSSGQTVYVGLTCDYGTASKVPVWDANKKLVSSGVDSSKITFLDNVTSDIQTQLNAKASTSYVDAQNAAQDIVIATKASTTYVDTADALRVLKSGDTMTGALIVDAGVSVGTRFLGTPDGSPGNFWMGLRGSGTEGERLAISIVGPVATGIVTGVSIAKPLYLTATGIVANRAVFLDGDKILKSSATTSTELGYVSGVTSAIQTQINTVSGALANYLPLVGGTCTGTVYNSAGSFWPYKGGDTNKGVYLFANNADGATYATYQGGLGSWNGIGFFCSNDSTTRFIFNTRDGTSSQTGKLTCAGVDTTSTVEVGLASNTTASIKLANSLNHITGNASEAYLFNGVNGYIAIGRNTTRSATEANLHMGTTGLDASIESIASNGAGYLPLYFYASKYYFSTGSVGIGISTPRQALDVTGNIVTDWNDRAIGTQYQTGSDYFLGIKTDVTGRLTKITSLTGDNSGGVTINTGSSATERMRITADGKVGIGITDPSEKLTVNGNGLFYGVLRTYGNATGGPSMIYSENATTGDGYAVFHLKNNSGSGAYWFLNSSTRAADGGPSSATLRNDVGNLLLQSQGGYGFKIDANNGYTYKTGGDNAKILYGPNSTWSAYLVVGAGTSEVTSNKAQVISTNGNLHLDAGLARGIYIGYYPTEGGQPNFIESYGTWNHQTGNAFFLNSAGVGTTATSITYSPPTVGKTLNIDGYVNGLYFYSTGSIGTSTYTGFIQFVNSGHYIGNFDRAPGGHVLAFNSGGYFFGGLAAGTVAIDGNGYLYTYSDSRVKNTIEYIEDGSLDKVLRLKPCSFKLNQDPYNVKIGFIAQDVEVVIPNAVDGKKYDWQYEINKETGEAVIGDDGQLKYKIDEITGEKIPRYRGLDTTAILAHSVKAIQELHTKQDEQQKEIETLSHRSTRLEERNQVLENHARKLESDFAEYKEQTDRRMTHLAELVLTVKGMLEEPKLKRIKTIVKE